MAINFLPNDPLAVNDIKLRSQAPKPNRPTSRAGFVISGVSAENNYAVGTPEFLYWQAREAVLATMEMWESLNGPVSDWARSANSKRLPLNIDDGDDLNAYYNGDSLSFFHAASGAKTTFSGASTDVVSHECGHALLDVIRPQLWDVASVEGGAFHEAFGDCVALLTALYDQPTRTKLLGITPDLKSPSFVESLSEDLSDGVRRALGASHPAAQPRRALNQFKWALPSTLPSSGPPPVLSREVHSFGRVFLGCFYDLITEIFASRPAQNEDNLWQAAQTAGKLLISGATNAPIVPRFFQAVGRTMVLADEQANGGANKDAIGKAFSNHGIVLGSSAMVAARAVLRGPAPKRKGALMMLTAATVSDLSRRFSVAKGQRPIESSLLLGAKPIAERIFKRAVNVGGLDPRLKGVFALGFESVLVGENNKRAAIVSGTPESVTTEDEVLAFVESLIDNDGLMLASAAKARKGVSKAKGAVAGSDGRAGRPTHVIRSRAGKKMIERVRFACGCRPFQMI